MNKGGIQFYSYINHFVSASCNIPKQMLSNMASGGSCHIPAVQIMQHASSQGHAANQQLKACNSKFKAVLEFLTFNQTATAEFEMV